MIVFCAGCSSVMTMPPDDDAGRDAGFDAGSTVDAGVDAFVPRDAGTDAFVSRDAGSDAFVPRDAGADAGPPPGDCLGSCAGVMRSREARECFSEAEASDLALVRRTTEANGTTCPDGRA